MLCFRVMTLVYLLQWLLTNRFRQVPTCQTSNKRNHEMKLFPFDFVVNTKHNGWTIFKVLYYCIATARYFMPQHNRMYITTSYYIIISNSSYGRIVSDQYSLSSVQNTTIIRTDTLWHNIINNLWMSANKFGGSYITFTLSWLILRQIVIG